MRKSGLFLLVVTTILIAVSAVPATALGQATVGGEWRDDIERFERIGSMSVARAAHQATPLPGGKVLITGGCGEDGCSPIHASAEVYDPQTGAFRPTAPMSTPRASHAAITLPDAQILVIGGWTGRAATATAEIYDPEADRWKAAGDMTVPRMSPAVAPLPDGRVLVTGGEPQTGAAHTSAEVFNPATGTFSAVSPMRVSRGSHVAVVLDDGRILIVGGHEESGKVLRSAEIYDPNAGAFRPTGEMGVPRHKHGAELLPDGRVLVAGGSDARDHAGRYSSTEIYDPATETFSPGPAMRWPRHKIRDAVVGLPSGAVLVAGGAEHPELYYPGRERFVPVEHSLGGSRMFATATRTPGGVLVTGGYDDRIRSTASAWLVHEPDPPSARRCADMKQSRTIEEVRKQYMDAFNAGRIDDLVELHTDRVVYMPAGMPAVVGRDELRRLVESSFQAAPEGFHFEFVAEELRRADGWAVERGFTRAYDNDEGMDIPQGKYVLLYEKHREGCWRIAWSITNTDRPPEGGDPESSQR